MWAGHHVVTWLHGASKHLGAGSISVPDSSSQPSAALQWAGKHWQSKPGDGQVPKFYGLYSKFREGKGWQGRMGRICKDPSGYHTTACS